MDTAASPPLDDRPRLGISRCLLGENVRYDGGHKRSRYLCDVLGSFVDFTGVCPEVECGLPVPRETMRLVGDPESPRLVTTRTGVDHTQQMLDWASRRLDALAAMDAMNGKGLCGFVFKKDSPSSGMERVKVYPEKGNGPGVRKGAGLFARAFMDRFPHLPVEDEGRLNDAGLRENFIERVFVMHRWRALMRHNPTLGGLVDFHTRHKLLVLAHNQESYRRLGRLTARGKEMDVAELFDRYLEELMAGLSRRATPKQHRNVLEHCLGYFKKQLDADEKSELLEIIERYARGYVPLVAPVTLVNHYVRKYGQSYLAAQVYLNPHPLELGLRNHV